MKLSEALRIGIQKRPVQAFGKFATSNDSSCALGAILDAFDFLTQEGNELGFGAEERIPALYKNVGPEQFVMWSLIIRMNDREKKTREEIANWLEAQGE